MKSRFMWTPWRGDGVYIRTYYDEVLCSGFISTEQIEIFNARVE